MISLRFGRVLDVGRCQVVKESVEGYSGDR